MKKLITLLMLALMATSEVLPQSVQTFCNPINISYRFSPGNPSWREAADPAIVLFKGNYYLFATQSSGYWYSSDLLNWKFVTTPDLPFEKDAPATAVYNGELYYCAIGTSLYKATDPIAGKWTVVSTSFPSAGGDPDIFVDTDNRVYLYSGCTNNGYIGAVELDPNNNFSAKGNGVNCFTFNTQQHGWERTGDYNTGTDNPWIEAAWMTKYNGKYYLEYSVPGTQYKSYADGYYTSSSPLGPFTFAPNNPFSAKPEGFIDGAGHASIFQDKYGNWWKICTMAISVKDIFERRLGLFPVTFDAVGNMIAHTEFGDLPMVMPDHKYIDVSELYPGWMMISYNKTGEASSSIAGHPINLAFDEEIRDYWSAATGNKGEWLSVDLGTVSAVNAIQINFAENNTTVSGRGIQGQQYLLEYSSNKTSWTTLVDKTTNNEDLTHQYHSFNSPVQARYFRVTNYRVPNGTFAISGLRVFGLNSGNKPSKVSSFKYNRDGSDSRNISLKWNKQKNATGYMIRFGHDKTMLYRSYQVYRDTTITIRSLNQGQLYWFAIDAFGETGITRGDTLEGAVNSGCMAVPYVNINGAAWQQVATSTLNSGGTLILGPQPLDGTWSWTGPSGYTATNREISFTNIEAGQAGSYIGSYTSPTGCKATATFTINVNGSNGCALAPIVPYMKVNTGGWQQINTASISAGGTIFMGPQPGDGTWSWAGSSGYTSTVREITLTNVQAAQAGQYKASYTNPAGCKGVVTFTVTLLKNAKVIDEVNGTSEIACFPNPADNFVALKNIAANTNITIFDTNGRLVLRTIVSANENINVSSLSPGVYFIKTVNQSLKLVKR